jgi:hypothetical protein
MGAIIKLHAYQGMTEGTMAYVQDPSALSPGIVMDLTGRSGPWLAAPDKSSNRLASAVSELPEEVLLRPSFVPSRRIADVLAHLGAAAEISTMLLEAGTSGKGARLQPDDRRLIQQRWGAMTPARQRDSWLEADSRHRKLLASLSPTQRESIRVPHFNGVVTLPVYAGHLLSEQSVLAWDVEVVLAPDATVPRAEVDLLWQRVDRVVTWSRDPATLIRLAPCQLSIELADAERPLALIVDVELLPTASRRLRRSVRCQRLVVRQFASPSPGTLPSHDAIALPISCPESSCTKCFPRTVISSW